MTKVRELQCKYIGNDPDLAPLRGETALWRETRAPGVISLQFDKTFPWSHRWTVVPLVDVEFSYRDHVEEFDGQLNEKHRQMIQQQQ